jgi:cytochrome c-type biogenesis protein CcmE
VDQFVASDDGESVRVIGTIAEPITTADQTKNVMFWLAHGGARLRVVYRGTLPDRFRVGWEGAAVGRWRTGDDAQRALAGHGFGSAEAGGVFVATDLAAYVPRF